MRLSDNHALFEALDSVLHMHSKVREVLVPFWTFYVYEDLGFEVDHALWEDVLVECYPLHCGFLTILVLNLLFVQVLSKKFKAIITNHL
jgi:hypothetical protein